MRFGYARVSTEDQSLQMQIDALKKVGCEVIIEEKISSGKDRPLFKALLKRLKVGDSLIVWSIDRLGRDGDENGIVLKGLVKRGISVMSLTENLHITLLSPPSELFMYRVLSAHAELEKAQISRRTKEGLISAKKLGRCGGRPRGLSPVAQKTAQKALDLRIEGKSISEISRILGISRNSVYKYLRYISDTDK